MKIKPVMSIQSKVPVNFRARDEGTQFRQVTRTLGKGMLIGMLGMTYPADITITTFA